MLSEKEKFINALKGARCRINPSAPDGSVMTMHNEVSGSLFTIIKTTGCWTTYGPNGGPTSQPPAQFQITNKELEDFLSNEISVVLEQSDGSKRLVLTDDVYGIVEWY